MLEATGDTMRDRTLIYLHIPKTGGSTMNHILDWNYERVMTLSVHRRIPELIALPDDAKRRLQCIKGTVFYGIHRYLPQDVVYITLMRHPVERVISHYFYQFDRKRRLGEPVPDWTLEEFIEHAPFQPTYQLRVLAGGDDIDTILHGPLPADALERARRNLATHFAVAGVLEHYDATLLLLQRLFGWPRVFYARQNVNRKRRPRAAFSPETLAYVERACAEEIALYEDVRQQLEAQIAAQGAGFQADLERLRRANRRFERFYHLAAPLRGTPAWGAAKEVIRRVNRFRQGTPSAERER